MGFVQRKLVKLVIRIVSFPKLTLAICALALLASVVLSMSRLSLSTNQNDLLTPSLPFFRDYLQFIQKFPENNSFVVIVEPLSYDKPPAGKRWMDFADRLGAALSALKTDVNHVDVRVDTAALGMQGLYFADWPEVKQFSSGGIGQLTALLGDDPLTHGYMIVPDETKRGTPAFDTQRILILNVYPQRDYSSLADVTEPLKRMRAAVDAVARDFPDFKKPVITGRPALEADEMETSNRDTRFAEILGLSVVFIVLLVFLRNLWLVIVAELCLCVGIGWTFGWTTLAVGRLNLLSLVFVIALIGIGMDYLIQILIRYRFEKKRYHRPQAVWARVFRYVSPPIFTACCGASGAFLVALLTNFSGAAELGLIAGGGLFLCLLTGYTILPALLTLFPATVGAVPVSRRYHDRAVPPAAGGVHLLPAFLWIAFAISSLWITLPPQFDPNLLKLQADGLESVREVRKVASWYAVVVSDDKDALEKARAALTPAAGEPTAIDRTESLFDAEEKEAWVRARSPLAPALNLATLPPIIKSHLISAPSATGKVTYALYVYPKTDLWNSGELQSFVEELERRTPANVTLTGIAPQLYHSTLEIHKAFLQKHPLRPPPHLHPRPPRHPKNRPDPPRRFRSRLWPPHAPAPYARLA